MKRLVTAVAFVALAVVGVVALAEATQNRPDVRVENSSSALTMAVKNRDGAAGIVEAQALWAVCNRTTRVTRLVVPLETVGSGTYLLSLQPALGDHARRRLVGCIEDTTLDGLIGDVVSLTHTRPA